MSANQFISLHFISLDQSCWHVVSCTKSSNDEKLFFGYSLIYIKLVTLVNVFVCVCMKFKSKTSQWNIEISSRKITAGFLLCIVRLPLYIYYIFLFLFFAFVSCLVCLKVDACHPQLINLYFVYVLCLCFVAHLTTSFYFLICFFFLVFVAFFFPSCRLA